jgi:hypothetical protein
MQYAQLNPQFVNGLTTTNISASCGNTQSAGSFGGSVISYYELTS